MTQVCTYDARQVANFLLDLAEERGVRLTQVSLLKLIYFSHGWYLSVKGRPLVSNDFEAWKYGPVVRVVRDEFKKFGSSEITTRAYRFDLFSGKRIYAGTVEDRDDAEFILSIFMAYQGYGVWELSDLTHEEGSPWDRVWNPKSAQGRLGLRLHNQEIKRHFDGLPGRMRLS